MKFSAISDIHVDTNGYQPVMESILAEVADRRTETLLIPGDISSRYTTTLEFLAELRQKAGIPVLWVPGNHDLWSRDCPELDAHGILARYGEDEGHLHGSRKLAESLHLVGTHGWYDYSLGGSQFSYDKLQTRKHMGRTWQDSLHAIFGMSDAEVHDREMHLLRGSLADIPADESVILMTHMVSHRRFTVPKLADYPEWEFFNAFLGSLALFDLAAHPAVRVALCGHVHHRTRFTQDGREYICCCLGYLSEFSRFGRDGIAANVKDAVQDFEL